VNDRVENWGNANGFGHNVRVDGSNDGRSYVHVLGLQSRNSNGAGLNITTNDSNSSNIVVEGCLLDGNGQNSGGANQVSLNISSNGTGSLSGVSISNCRIINNGGTGTSSIALWVQDSSDVRISDTEVSDAGGEGVKVSNSTGVTFNNVDVLRSGQRAYLIDSAAEATIYGGRIVGNTIGGTSRGAVQFSGSNNNSGIIGAFIQDNGDEDPDANCDSADPPAVDCAQIRVAGTTTSRFRILNNIIHLTDTNEGTRDGIRFNAAPTADIEVGGNVIRNFDSLGIRFNSHSPGGEYVGLNFIDGVWENIDSPIVPRVDGQDFGTASLGRNGTTCATAATAGATCDSSVTWSTSFADTNYTVQCNGQGIVSGVPAHGGVQAKAVGSATFRTVAVTAAAAEFDVIECTAFHD
jgi:hypothetical protein